MHTTSAARPVSDERQPARSSDLHHSTFREDLPIPTEIIPSRHPEPEPAVTVRAPVRWISPAGRCAGGGAYGDAPPHERRAGRDDPLPNGCAHGGLPAMTTADKDALR